MTERLYDKNAYLTEFEARVIKCTAVEGKCHVLLDKTAFFPEQGGQTCDKGTINGSEVLDVYIKDNLIYHVLESEMTEGEIIAGKVDFNHRFRNMQMHSGEHIFSGTVFNTFGFNNVGFHLSDNSATMDFDGKMDESMIAVIEKRVNDIIAQNLNIIISYPTEEALKNIEYRSKKEISEALRLVEIPGVDICACCAPHVKTTSEIGLFKVTSFMNYKGGVRVNYLCGLRAVEYFCNCLNRLSQIDVALSAKEGNEITEVNRILEENKRLAFELSVEKNKVIDFYTKETFCTNVFNILFLPKEYTQNIRAALEIMHSRYGGNVAVFAGDDEGGYRYAIESDCFDLSTLNNELKTRFSAKGGGRKESIQGNLTAAGNALIDFLAGFSFE